MYHSTVLALLFVRSIRAYLQNDVSDLPEVVCQQNSMKIMLNMKSAFTGHIYVKDHLYDPNCHLDMTSGYRGFRNAVITVPYRECVVARTRTVENGAEGIAFAAVVIVQFHSALLTAEDKAYRMRCFYMEAQKDVTESYQVSMLPTDATVYAAQPMPTCEYRIRSGGRDGIDVRFANIGDRIHHEWICSGADNSAMGLLVHSCTAKDSVGNTYQLLDAKGCAIDVSALPNLVYDQDGLGASVEMMAFRFATQMAVNFHCRLKLCLRIDGGCNGVTPPSCPNLDVTRSQLTQPPNYQRQRPPNAPPPSPWKMNEEQTGGYDDDPYNEDAPEYRSGHRIDDSVVLPPVNDLLGLPPGYRPSNQDENRPQEPDYYDEGQRKYPSETRIEAPSISPNTQYNDRQRQRERVYPSRIESRKSEYDLKKSSRRRTAHMLGPNDLEKKPDEEKDAYLNQLYSESDLGQATTFHPFLARADGFFYDAPGDQFMRRERLSVDGSRVWEEAEATGKEWDSGIDSERILVFTLDDPLPSAQGITGNRSGVFRDSADLTTWGAEEVCLSRLGLIQGLSGIGVSTFVILVLLGWLQRRLIIRRLADPDASLIAAHLKIKHNAFQT